MKHIKFFTYYLLVSVLLSGISISCKDKITITDITLDKDELILSHSGTATLTASLLPYSASDKMKWSTNNSNIAVVESDDKAGALSHGIVTAKSAGTAIITVATKDGKHTATCTVSVINPEPELISVEGDTFTMGCTDGNCDEESAALPAHKVTLSSYKIAKYPVTQQQWEAVMGNNPSYFKGRDLPVERVSWNDVQVFITKLNALTGKNYRLPTEAEWEFAARGGKESVGYQYSGSNDINAVAWYIANSGKTIHSIGTKAANELEIYDMSGNVFEWCSDWFGAYTEDTQTNPTGPVSGSMRIARGGDALNFDAYACRVSFRISAQPNLVGYALGFRLAHP